MNLYEIAQLILPNGYAPYSKFPVGAALLTKNGVIYRGVNVENSSFGVTMCAERNALFTAITSGEREFEAIAIASNKDYTWPCGICRQAMFEFNPSLKVITGKDKNSLNIMRLDELLVNGFRL